MALDRDDTAVLAASPPGYSTRTPGWWRPFASTSDEATGRLLGLAIDRPYQAALIEELLLIGQGVDLVTVCW